MRIEIDAPGRVKAGAECRIRVLLLNDSYQPVTISRNAFVGPNVMGWLIEATGDFTPGLLVMMLTLVLSGGLALAVRHGTASRSDDT